MSMKPKDLFVRGNNKRTHYRLPVSELVGAIQAAAIYGFALRCVAAGSLWATVALTQDEYRMLFERCIRLELDC